MIRSFIIKQLAARIVALLVSWGVPENMNPRAEMGDEYEWPSPYSEEPYEAE